jgi:hypothetical protein
MASKVTGSAEAGTSAAGRTEAALAPMVIEADEALAAAAAADLAGATRIEVNDMAAAPVARADANEAPPRTNEHVAPPR